MSLLFRSATLEDVPPVARIASHSFPWVAATLDEWEALLVDSPLAGLPELWVGEEEGRIVAACRLYSYRQWIARRPIPVMGLGMVTIAPTARRRGLAAKLVGTALEFSRQRGDLASSLYPFRTSFYRKLGYGLAGEVQQFRIPPSALPDDPGRSRVRLVETEADRGALMELYESWASRQTGQMQRPPRRWEQVWQKDTRQAVLHREENGSVSGYVVFRYAHDPARNYRAVEIEEIVWTSRAARSALYGWISSLSDQWEQVVYRAHPDEGFTEFLRETRYPVDVIPRWHYWFAAATVMHGPMFRLLNVPEAWRERRVKPGPPLSVALEVHDPTVSENSGTWLLTAEGAGLTVEEGEGRSADLKLKLGIEALSRIYIGAISPSLAVMTGQAQVEGESRLKQFDRMLRVPRPWTFERF